MFENIRLSFQGIWSHKMRSFLTMLGIIIGIASIIAIVSTIKGTNEQIKKNLIGSGTNTVDILLSQSDEEYEFDYYGFPDGVPVIDDSAKEEIQKLDEVDSISLYHKRVDYDMSIYYKTVSLSGGRILGIDNSYFDTSNYIITKGRLFSDRDFKEFRKVVIIDQDAAFALFQDTEPIGQTIEIKKEPYVVIGVVTESDSYTPVINSIEDYYMYMQDGNSGKVFVTSASWPNLYQYDEPQHVLIQAKSTDVMSKAGKKVADILNQNITSKKTELKYKAKDILETARQQEELSEQTNKQLIWIASISLLVGGIGVMNIMLVSVTERTREIGLKKAIGAPKIKILVQFLTEASVLTSLGGLIGVIVGIVLSQVISKVSDTPVAISIPAALGSVVFSMLIGIVFGLLPSYKAANLNPIDALRYE